MEKVSTAKLHGCLASKTERMIYTDIKATVRYDHSNKQDADTRWVQVQKQATTDQANCAAVVGLPSLRQKLNELLQRQ